MIGSDPFYGIWGTNPLPDGIAGSGPIVLFSHDMSTSMVLSSARCGHTATGAPAPLVETFMQRTVVDDAPCSPLLVVGMTTRVSCRVVSRCNSCGASNFMAHSQVCADAVAGMWAFTCSIYHEGDV